MTVKWDMNELNAFTIHLGRVPARLQPELVPVVKRLMQEAKNGFTADLRGSSNKGFRAIAGRVRYTEPALSGGVIQSKLGIDKGGAGNLGNIAVFGTYKGGGTHLHPSHYVETGMSGTVSAIQRVLKGVLTS